jgi:uncharacterized damage-inducible protein DinB
MKPKPKVFGIGFHKTATTSLAAAFYILGYNVTGYFGTYYPDIGDHVYDLAFDLADRFDAAQDTPWPVLYKELDERYPGSKFVLTIRPTDKWIDSVLEHFKNQHIPIHEWIYGVRTAEGNEDVYIRRYEDHNREVQEYFKDRPDDLLVMDITHGDGWEKLCPFLGQPIPPFDFPAQNAADARSNHYLKRGINYLKRKLTVKIDPRRAGQMGQGVSASFVRDILHYHYSMYTNLWDDVTQLTEEQFLQEFRPSQGSLHDHLLRQISEELAWLQRLKGDRAVEEHPLKRADCQSKETVYERWKNNQLWLREYVSNLTDEDCNSRVPSGNEYVWEVFVHLMNSGTGERYLIRQILGQLGLPVEEPNFLNFFSYRIDGHSKIA